MIRAPSGIRCISMPVICMTEKTTTSVRGMAVAITRPGRIPRLTKLATRMIATDCHSDVMNSEMALSTVAAWSATSFASMPIGKSVVASAIAR